MHWQWHLKVAGIVILTQLTIAMHETMKHLTQGSLKSASSAPPINGVSPMESIRNYCEHSTNAPEHQQVIQTFSNPKSGLLYRKREREVCSSKFIQLETGIRFAFVRAPEVCFSPSMGISIPESLPLLKRNQNNSGSLKTYPGHLTLLTSLLSCHYKLGRKPGSIRHTTLNFYFCFQKMPV